jgi:hypothetical protein
MAGTVAVLDCFPKVLRADERVARVHAIAQRFDDGEVFGTHSPGRTAFAPLTSSPSPLYAYRVRKLL